MIEYTRIIKICNMYFEEVDPKQSLPLTRTFTLEEAERWACKYGFLSKPRPSTNFRQIPITDIKPSSF